MKKSILRKSLRNSVRYQLNIMPNKVRYEKSIKIVNNILNDIRIYNSKTFAIFFPFKGEIDTRPLIDTLLKLGKNVLLPIINKFDKKSLIFSKYDYTIPLILNKLGIFEPKIVNKNSVFCLSDIDIIFVPFIAFDKRGIRLGNGLGYYDRLLKGWEEKYSFIPVGIGYDCQKVSSIPDEDWDIPLKEIITPSLHICF